MACRRMAGRRRSRPRLPMHAHSQEDPLPLGSNWATLYSELVAEAAEAFHAAIPGSQVWCGLHSRLPAPVRRAGRPVVSSPSLCLPSRDGLPSARVPAPPPPDSTRCRWTCPGRPMTLTDATSSGCNWQRAPTSFSSWHVSGETASAHRCTRACTTYAPHHDACTCARPPAPPPPIRCADDMQSQIFGSCVASANSPPALVRKGLAQWLAIGVPADKLVLGLPWYGERCSSNVESALQSPPGAGGCQRLPGTRCLNVTGPLPTHPPTQPLLRLCL